MTIQGSEKNKNMLRQSDPLRVPKYTIPARISFSLHESQSGLLPESQSSMMLLHSPDCQADAGIKACVQECQLIPTTQPSVESRQEIPMPARVLFACLISVLLLTCSQSTAQTSASGTPAQTASSASGPTDDLAATKADLAKMRVLVTQMQNNLGVTTTSTTPLYHQFDLQIQMWQLLIAQMERRIDRMERSKETPHRE
jgi:hypothetical protein